MALTNIPQGWGSLSHSAKHQPHFNAILPPSNEPLQKLGNICLDVACFSPLLVVNS